MNIRKRINAFSILCFLCSIGLNGQSFNNKAIAQYDLHAYDLAVENFKKAYAEDKTCTDCLFRIGECYMLMNNNIEAYHWFKKLPSDYQDPEYNFAFGSVLKKLGRFEEAEDQFMQYAKHNKELGIHFAEGCGYAQQIITNENLRHIDHLGANSTADDFSACLFNGKLIFASFRTDIDQSASPDYSLLYKNDKFGVSLMQDVFLGDINVASLSIDKEGTNAAFHKHNYINGFHQVHGNDKSASIHFAKLDNQGNFLKITPFSYNSIEFANAFPYLAEDNSYMIFSSNMPGGLGGFDLYISYKTEIGWTEPLNLGTLINSPGNEIAPTVSAGQLFFCSDYHHGIGGYDIFSSEFRDGYYTYPKNMGKGVNSPEDDLYPFYDSESDLFYFSSNRMGGIGNLDIYAASGESEMDYLSDYDASLTKPEAFTLVDMRNQEATFQTVSLKEDPSNDLSAYKVPSSISPVDRVVSHEVRHLSQVDMPKVEFVSLAALDDDLLDYAVAAEFDGATLSTIINLDQNPNASGRVYFIQVGAFYQSQGEISQYTALSNIGNVYKMSESGATKIRLGYYNTRSEAEAKLRQVKDSGFQDAFLTHTKFDHQSMELLAGGSAIDQDVNDNYVPDEVRLVDTSPNREYKVRLASYSDPNWFDINAVKDIGTIEQWSKKNWTIFVLSGYESKQSAMRALQLAKGKGFADAYVVLDDRGILKKVE